MNMPCEETLKDRVVKYMIENSMTANKVAQGSKVHQQVIYRLLNGRPISILPRLKIDYFLKQNEY